MAQHPDPAGRSVASNPFESFLPDDIARNSIRLILTRWVAGAMVLLATAFCGRVLGLPLPEMALYVVGVIILAYNGVLALLMKNAQSVGGAHQWRRVSRVVVLQVALDWVSMAAFLHLTGGICSPAIPILLIHMLMVTILLPGQSPYLYVALGIGMLGLLTILERTGVLAHYAVIPGIPPSLHRDPVFIGAQLAFFSITAFAIVYLTYGIMQRLRERERQIAALLMTTQAVSSTLSVPEVMDRLARSAAQALGVRRASIRLLDESGEHLTMMAAYGLSQSYLDKGPVDLSSNPLAQQALLGGPLIVADAATDPRVQYSRQVMEEGIRSMVVAPILGRGRPLGILRVYSGRPHRFAPSDAAFVVSIAQQGATALENALAHDALHRANEERAQFVRIVTHELRAPVSGAQSLLRVLMHGLAGTLEPQQTDILERLERRLDTLIDLINDLLALAATKTGAYKEPLQVLPLQPIIQQVIGRQREQASEKNIALTFEMPESDLAVCGTEDGLARIFDNLIGNAVKYTLPGGSVHVTVEVQISRAVVTVSDTGIGIPEADLPRLWNEFFRASNAKKSGIAGTGLGLAIVRQLVERFGGMVSVRSIEGEGTTFKVTLPLDRCPGGDPESVSGASLDP